LNEAGLLFPARPLEGYTKKRRDTIKKIGHAAYLKHAFILACMHVMGKEPGAKRIDAFSKYRAIIPVRHPLHYKNDLK
jgi:hypothetical protein